MRHKARVAGLVTYLNNKSQRLSIPEQDCELDDGNGLGPYVLVWKDKNGKEVKTEFTLEEFAQYQGTKALKLLEEPKL